MRIGKKGREEDWRCLEARAPVKGTLERLAPRARGLRCWGRALLVRETSQTGPKLVRAWVSGKGRGAQSRQRA